MDMVLYSKCIKRKLVFFRSLTGIGEQNVKRNTKRHASMPYDTLVTTSTVADERKQSIMQYIEKGTSQYWRTILTLFLGSLVSYGLMYTIQPLFPALSAEFSLSPSTASLAMSVTTAGLAFATLLVACTATMLNRKLAMTASLVGTALMTIAVAWSGNFHLILGFRALEGIFVAGFPAVAMAYINEEFEPGTTGFIIGIYISGTSIGGMAGRLIASLLTDLLSWRLALSIMGLFGLLIGLWFFAGLPKSKHFIGRRPQLSQLVLGITGHLRNTMLWRLYFIAFLIMGAQTTVYNYIGFSLMAPPYYLSQSAIGAIFTIYLVGTFSSTFMGGLADRYSTGKTLCLSIGIMLAGASITLAGSLVGKLIGMVVFTFGFFAAHAIACGWVGKCCVGDKAQASAIYLLFYYFGGSVIGTFGGLPYQAFGWNGVVFLSCFVLCAAAVSSISLLSFESQEQLGEGEEQTAPSVIK